MSHAGGCEFCGSAVEEPSHVVVNDRVFLEDEDTCADCGYSDAELLDWVEEHAPGALTEAEKDDLRTA